MSRPTEGAPGSTRAVAAAVAAGRISATALVEAALDRIRRLDPALRAVVALREEAALAEAATADAARASGSRGGPLAGVPALVKDLEDVAGMPTRKGSLLLADAPAATADGLVPARLRAAGAIVVGKTALPEFAIEGYTASLLTGATGNPWAPRWSPGGSSGGSAAALAAGLVPVATATDGGGSIRIPAAFCGLVGLKPSNGVIPRRPIPDWIDFSTDGPLATSVDDLRLLLSVTAGPEPGDPTALPAPLPGLTAGQGRRPARIVAAQRTSDLGPLPAGVASAFEAAVAAFAALFGLPVTWIEPGSLFRGLGGDPDLDWFTLAGAEHVASLGRAWIEAGLGRMHPASQAFFRDALAVPIDEYLAARRRRFAYVRAVDDLLGAAGVLLTPTVASEGWLADGTLPGSGRPPGPLPPEVFSTAVQNVTGHPAVSLPAGRLPNGLPFGLQVTGPRFADPLLLDVAEAWERAHPWPRTAPGYEPFEALLG